MAATSANVRSQPGEAHGLARQGRRRAVRPAQALHRQRDAVAVVAFRAVRDGDLKVMRELA